MDQILRYWRAIRSAVRASCSKGLVGTFEFWVVVTLIALATGGVFFLILYSDEVAQNGEFGQHGVVTLGQVVDESICSNGTRFGHEYCYDILFTTADGEQVVFGARGLTSYRAGLGVLPKTMFVQYLPYRPTSARLAGDSGEGGLLLGLGLAMTGFALFCLFGLIRAQVAWYSMQELLKHLESLIDKRCFDEAVDFAMGNSNLEDRNTLLATLILRLFELKEVHHAQQILAREDIPDLEKAFGAQGMEIR